MNMIGKRHKINVVGDSGISFTHSLPHQFILQMILIVNLISTRHAIIRSGKYMVSENSPPSSPLFTL